MKRIPIGAYWRAAVATMVVLLTTAAAVTTWWTPAPAATDGAAVAPRMAVAAPPANSVVPFGDASLGVNALAGLNAPIVGMAATPDGGGYWMVASDGGIFAYGDAHFYGSTGNIRLNQPVVGMAATPDGKGYWMVAADGGIFAYGDAHFYGSTGNIRLNQPVVGMAATPDGKGYWLVAADGGIFAYGDAHFYGSTGDIRLNQPVVGMAADPRRKGLLAGGRRRRHLRLRRRPLLRVDRQHPSQPAGGGDGRRPRRKGLLAGGRRWRHLLLRRPIVLRLRGCRPTCRSGRRHRGHTLGRGVLVGIRSARPLAGKVVGIDPGHNGLNYTAPQIINQPVWNGQEYESCDTTGTETASGYTEAQFNFDVATYLRSDLEAEGASVVMTRQNNDGVGPCVTTRAAIINSARADVAVDIHADGGPTTGRGFAVLEPVADGPNSGVISSSAAFGSLLRNTFAAGTPMPVSSYDGVDGIQPRNNLAGLNLTTVPKVLIECGNMQNATDAAILVTPTFQQEAATAMARAITLYLAGPSS